MGKKAEPHDQQQDDVPGGDGEGQAEAQVK